MFKTVLFHTVLLIVLSLVIYAISEEKSPTAFIPAFFGVALSVSGALGVATGKRKLFFHLLLGLALLGVLAGFGMGFKTVTGDDVKITKLLSMFGMGAICLSLIVSGFKNFFKVRKAAKIAGSEASKSTTAKA